MYPTDLTESQWQFIEKTLDLGIRKRKHSLQLIWNAINYLVKSGCQWRMLPCNFLCPIKVILADGGYRGEIIEQVKTKFGYIIQVVMRCDNKKSVFKPTHKRWVVERIFAWFDNDRRLCRNYELLMESSENMVKLSAIKLLLNKI
jgi:transposase